MGNIGLLVTVSKQLVIFGLPLLQCFVARMRLNSFFPVNIGYLFAGTGDISAGTKTKTAMNISNKICSWRIILSSFHSPTANRTLPGPVKLFSALQGFCHFVSNIETAINYGIFSTTTARPFLSATFLMAASIFWNTGSISSFSLLAITSCSCW